MPRRQYQQQHFTPAALTPSGAGDGQTKNGLGRGRVEATDALVPVAQSLSS